MTFDPIESARLLLNLAERVGAEEAEVFGLVARSVDVDLRKDLVEMASESYNQGLGLRAVLNGAVGFSSTSDLSKLETVAQSAVAAARARKGDAKWRRLPLQERLASPQGVFDPAIEKMGPEDCIEMAAVLLEGCAAVSGAKPSTGGIACASITEFVLNSNGVEAVETSTVMYASLDAVAKGDEELATGYEFENSRDLQPRYGINGIEHIGHSAAELAKRSLGGRKGETGETEVLLGPVAFAEILEAAFVPSVYADNVQKSRSSLIGKRGQLIGDENLTIIDDGLLKGGMATSAFDGEGVPSQRTSIIEEGVLNGFLYDSYTAGKDDVKSTGNAGRAGYSGVPRVGTTNLIVASSDPRDVLAETKDGVFVNAVIGAHTANPVSGDFSVEGRNVFLIKDGEVEKPLRSLMLAGNVFDLLKQVEVGTDTRTVGSVVTPTVKVRMRVVGS